MKIVFLEWNSYCNRGMIDAFESLGINVIRCKLKSSTQVSTDEIREALLPLLKGQRPEFVFSFNYVPNVSQVCQENELSYAAYVYDSPHIQVYSYTVLNPCNHIFLFDYALYDKLSSSSIPTVHYLPLAADGKRIFGKRTDFYKKKYEADISFVGSLYDEPKHCLYEKFGEMSDYAKGYLDAITKAQKMVYGYNFLEELLVPEIIEEMEKAYPTDPNPTTVMKPEEIYADYVLSRHVTAMERKEILQMLGGVFPQYDIRLYTNNDKALIKGVQNRGRVDYDKEMPCIFASSKINLNISLRSIKTGIPLRAFDIMGCGGFLLSNYQQELAEYFEADTDFVYYENYNDLMGKVEYYLTHEKERKEIALNGMEKTLREHTLEMRAKEIVRKVVGEKNENSFFGS